MLEPRLEARGEARAATLGGRSQHASHVERIEARQLHAEARHAALGVVVGTSARALEQRAERCRRRRLGVAVAHRQRRLAAHNLRRKSRDDSECTSRMSKNTKSQSIFQVS